jgi:IS4 transposase
VPPGAGSCPVSNIGSIAWLIRRLGTSHHTRLLSQPFRVVCVAPGTSHTARGLAPPVLVTDCLDVEAEVVALASRFRWTVELCFRWLKCILGCRHVLSQGANGVHLQVYAAIIASLLISLWVKRPPTKRRYELLSCYLSGWASEAELIAHIDRLHLKAPPQSQQ